MKTREGLFKFMEDNGWRYSCHTQVKGEEIKYCFDKYPSGILLNIDIDWHEANNEFLATLYYPLDLPVVSIQVTWVSVSQIEKIAKAFVEYALKIGIIPNTSNRERK